MKKLLPLAVASALFGVNGAQAVHVNSDGLGQVLLYPFYTTEGGQDTLINVVNTTNEFKAVKVRILESMNSDEVLDFNLYLSPKDHWSAVITADTAGEGAVIRTADNSCTVPNRLSNGETIPFRNFEYANDTIAPGDSLARTKEGYVEIIEMGDVDIDDSTPTGTTPSTLGDLLAFAIEHDSNGVPGNCAILETAWQSGSLWGGDEELAMLPPSGGLYGYGVIIDVQEGTDASYDALALDDFSTSILHTSPGSVNPSLGSGTNEFDVLDGTTIYSGTGFENIDAVSATLMFSQIANDFVLEQAIAAGTDWVITFPTKKEYVNSDVTGDGVNDAIAPFTSPWLGNVASPAIPRPSCEAIDITYYDREEQGVAPSGLDFSPPPPGQQAFALCAEANVLTFNSANVLEASTRSGADLSVIHENGWLTIDFTNTVFSGQLPVVYRPGISGPTTGIARVLPTSIADFEGLPATGFAVQKYVNGDLGGVLSNYAGAITHKGVRSISD
jgi:hypothetical protein